MSGSLIVMKVYQKQHREILLDTNSLKDNRVT